MKVLHGSITALAWGIFAFSLVRMLLAYPSLPEPLGMHFNGSGEFDLFGSKTEIFTLFYPYIVSIVFLTVFEVFTLVSARVKIGLKVNETGERKIRAAVSLLLDILKLVFSFFFAGVWADCVIRQRALNTSIPVALLAVVFCSFNVCIGFLIALRVRCPKEK